jgi:hypothetical protein
MTKLLDYTAWSCVLLYCAQVRLQHLMQDDFL